jgi:sigma-E factor negative regulatory protein RseC
MRAEARVIAVEKDTVRVRFLRPSACATSCKNCGGCGLMNNLETEVSLPAPPGRHFQPGDRVWVGMEASGFLRAAFLLYLVPLVFFFGGYAAGERLFSRLGLPGLGEAGGALAAFLLMALAFLLIRKLDRRLAGTGRYRLAIVADPIIDVREKQGEKERF